jgi:imidazolonepropionase-like amidohydrolase
MDADTGAELLAIRAARGFDGERDIPGGVTVLARDGLIAAVCPGYPDLPEDCAVAEYPDATVLPGLIDTHVHLCCDGRDGARSRLPALPGDELDAVIGEALHRQLQAGVTTVRDLGDHRWAVIERRRRVATPAIVASGPPVTTRRGHCWQFGGEAAGPAALRAAVAERVERGADVVKVMLSGGAFTPHRDLLRSQFSRTGLGTLTGRAHTAGLPVTAHAHGVSAIEQAIDAGVDGIEHCGCLTESGIGGTDALLESLAARRIAVCPTLGSRDGTQRLPRYGRSSTGSGSGSGSARTSGCATSGGCTPQESASCPARTPGPARPSRTACCGRRSPTWSRLVCPGRRRSRRPPPSPPRCAASRNARAGCAQAWTPTCWW